MNKMTLVALTAVSLLACGAPAKPPSPSSAKQATKTGATALKAKKPATAMSTTQTPKPVLAAKTGGGKMVAPKDLTNGGTVTVDTWAFSDVDLDGDGTPESGVVATAKDDVAAWWSGSFFVEEEQATVPYEAMLWTEAGGVAFIIDYGQSAIACGADAEGAGGCIVCDADGACSLE
jgi:hypothetical protein